jgi:alpha-D-ribose 1-methylphosphonate 5-triphosphate synthase subunit PhnH
MNQSTPIALSALSPGFSDPVHDTQAVFRTLLDALARPGTLGIVERVLPRDPAATTPRTKADRATLATLLALCDSSTPVWLACFAIGEPETPEQSVTLLIRVDSLTGGAPVVLRGPGIEHTQSIAPAGLPSRFWRERAELAPLFPCGIDCYFVCGDALVGLPRTTHVEFN